MRLRSALALSRVPRGALPLLLAVTLTFHLDECALDGATVERIPPNVIRTLATYDCGGLRCWVREVQQEGKTVRRFVVCEQGQHEHERLVPR